MKILVFGLLLVAGAAEAQQAVFPKKTPAEAMVALSNYCLGTSGQVTLSSPNNFSCQWAHSFERDVVFPVSDGVGVNRTNFSISGDPAPPGIYDNQILKGLIGYFPPPPRP